MSAEEWQRPPSEPFTAETSQQFRTYAESVMNTGDFTQVLPVTCALLGALDELDAIRTERDRYREALEGLADGLAAHFDANPESEWAMVTREESEQLSAALVSPAGGGGK